MEDTKDSVSDSDPSESEQYGRAYYENEGYSRENPIWKPFFGHIADRIIESFRPSKTLDAGCAIGMLVEELRVRGVDATGFDFSEFAINSIPQALQPFCYVGSITDEIDGFFDLITCIEVLEHLPEEQAEAAISNLCRHTDVVLFSSTPDDFEEPTHLNVREGGYWASLFASQGFYRDFQDDVASNVSPQSILFRRGSIELGNAVDGYENLLTDKSIQIKLRSSEALDELALLANQLDAANVRLGLSRVEIKELEIHQRLNEAYRQTRLFRYTIEARELYTKLRRVKNRGFLRNQGRSDEVNYREWIDDYEILAQELINSRMKRLSNRPLLSVVMPTFNISADYLKKAVNSVLSQSYENWELCIADDCSTNSETTSALKEIEGWDERIKVIYRDANGHISAASNSALEIASGDWVALLDHDDQLAPHALAAFVVTISENPNATLLYSDRDMIDDSGSRFHPYFKPDFDPELILSLNYICHLTVIKKSVVDSVGGFRLGVEGSQDWDLSLRVIAESDAQQIVHIPHVLYHWRLHPGSVSTSLGVKPYAAEAAEKAIANYLTTIGRKAELRQIEGGGWYRVIWELPEHTIKVALIVDGASSANVSSEVKEILKRTAFEFSEVVVVSDDSVQLGSMESSSFSSRINAAVSSVNADYVCVLRSNCLPASPDWVEELLRNASQPNVGVVGPSIVSGEGTFVHTGIVLGIDEIAGELYKGTAVTASGVYGRLVVVRSFSGVDKSCMFFKKELWEEVGGFSEQDAPNHFSDVDFCLRLGEVGQRTLWTPFSRLVVSQVLKVGPSSVEPRERELEEEVFKNRWSPQLLNDPYFNPNLLLSSENDGFLPARPSRVFEIELNRLAN